MFLKNTGARLVVINTPKPFKKSYQLIPTYEAVEIPDEEINEVVQEYIDGLVALGDLTEAAAPKKAAKPEEVKEPAKRGPKPKEETQE